MLDAMILSLPRNIGRIIRSQPLRRQLLLSHLSVAAVGLVLLFLALALTQELRNRIDTLALQDAPLAQASLQMLAGVQHSLSSLRGWVNSADPRFLTDWQTAWLQDIEPALQQIQRCPSPARPYCAPQRTQQLVNLLNQLRVSQQQVKAIAHSPDNEPTQVFYRQHIKPQLAQFAALIDAPQRVALHAQVHPSQDALIRLNQIHDTFHATTLVVREILGNDGLAYVPKLRQHLQQLSEQIAQASAAFTVGSAPQTTVLELQRDWPPLLERLQTLIAHRQAPDWNRALHQMAIEITPLAAQATDLAAKLADDAKQTLQREIEAAHANSTRAIQTMVVLIGVMVLIAYGMAKAHSRALDQPITALLEAIHQMQAGLLEKDLPVSGADELARLTGSFNTMRDALWQAQEALHQSNSLLEQRISERTAQLALSNASLSREIAERSQANHALWESDARLRAMTQAIPDLIFVVDEEGRYREILTTGQGRIALDNAPIRGKLLSEAHPPDKAALFLELIQRALQTRQIQMAEYELATASGRRWFESRTVPLDIRFADASSATSPHPQGDLFGPPDLRRFVAKAAALVAVRDITQRKQTEAQLRQAHKMQAIGQITGEISHDFNNLLAVIMGNLELLNEQLEGQPELAELASQALGAANRGANLTQRLLAFSRRQPLTAQATSLNQLVLDMLDLMRRTLGAQIQVETRLADDLGLVSVDPGQFENALLNLVINARDAMPKGGQLTLKTTNSQVRHEDENTPTGLRAGPYVMLTVRDTGTGMTPEAVERAFEPFFTTKETGKGSGLGLSMVYGLVKQSNGHITLHSEPGQGTTVRLCLPRIETAIAASPTRPTVVNSAVSGTGEKILVVEDDPEVQRFAVTVLRGLGYTPLAAAEGTTALRILQTEPEIAALFTDIVMPGAFDGIRLALEARRLRPGLPVLLTSGYTTHTLDSQDPLQNGMELLPKPYRKHDLAEKLRLLLRNLPPLPTGGEQG